MYIRILQRFYFLLSLVLLLVACRESENNNESLIADAAQFMETDHKQALELLKQVKSGLLNEEEYIWFSLLQIRGWGIAGLNVGEQSDAVVLNAKNYYIEKNIAAKATYACYVYGYVNYMAGDLNKALYNYLQADEWAERSGYKLPDFNYSTIPYNIALIYRKEGKYKESLSYLDKAIKYISNKKLKYQHELFALELKGINFRLLDQPDSALFYYDKALQIVERYNDTENKSRIYYNQSLVYYTIKDYSYAKDMCIQAIEATHKNDSIALGHQYLRLAEIYDKTNQIDSAITTIYKSKKYLTTTHINSQRLLYEILFQMEEKRGNIGKANEFKKLYNYYKEQSEQPVNVEITRLQDELKQVQAHHIGETIRAQVQNREVVQVEGRHRYILLYTLCAALLVALLIYLFYSFKNRKIRRRYEDIISGKEQELNKIITEQKQEFEQESQKIRMAYREELEEKETRIQEAEKKAVEQAVNKAYKKTLREHECIIKDWEKKYKESEKEKRKHYKQLVLWNKERRQFFKMHMKEIMKDIQSIRSLKEIQELLSSGNIVEAKRKISEIRNTLSWNDIKGLLIPGYSDIFEQLKAEFPTLDDDEYILCCLYVTDEFSPTDIMLLMNISEEYFKNLKNSTSQKLSNVGKNFAYLKNYGVDKQENSED